MSGSFDDDPRPGMGGGHNSEERASNAASPGDVKPSPAHNIHSDSSDPDRRTSTGGGARVPAEVNATADWGSQVMGFVYNFARAVTPSGIFCLMIFFAIRAFSHSLGEGLRSAAALLLPILAFAFFFYSPGRHQERTPVEEPKPSLALRRRISVFVSMLAVGALLMALLAVSTTAPLPELVFSAAFSVLMTTVTQDRWKDTYSLLTFGAILGALIYVVIAGVPAIKTREPVRCQPIASASGNACTDSKFTPQPSASKSHQPRR